MLKDSHLADTRTGKIITLAWTSIIILLFFSMAAVIFPYAVIRTAPKTHVAEGVNGYVALADISGGEDGEIFKLRGEWEFYPGQLYTFSDFTGGRPDATRIARFPHFWKTEPEDVMERVGYATYRMRVRVPGSFDGIGIYSRSQYSAYEIFLNDIPICEAGVVSEDFGEYEAAYMPTNGYTFASIGSEGRTFSVILHVQNGDSDLGGLGNDIFIGSAESVKNLRTTLVMINGLVSGGLLLLFICLALIYLSGRERTEYLDYTIVSLIALFISLTYGGESLMHSIGFDSVFLLRLEYCAFISGAFFASYNDMKRLIRSKAVFIFIYSYIVVSSAFFLFAPMLIASRIRNPVIAVSAAFFVLPLLSSVRDTVRKHDFNAIVSLLSYSAVVAGICFYIFGGMPWDSVDLLSISILFHCVLQMLIFLHRYQGIERSLTEMKETLEERIVERTIELTLTKEKAEAANVSKSNFLATMSHEIRTPMNAIMGISDLIRTDNLDDVQISYLSDIKKSSKALLQIINDILDFSKIEAGKLEIIPVHFNLMAAYDNICSICQFSADAKKLKFTHSFAPDVPHYIFGDETRYRQIILNIINNAIKYTRDGYVDFKVEKIELYGIEFLSFTVEDSGIGIKTEDFPKLFNSFEQLDSEANRKIVGTGLGLSISKLLVTLMNGDIQVKSEYGKGSVFTVYLPLEEGDSTKVAVQENYVPVMARDAKVLVVDDNRINITVAEGFLATHGIIPDTALSGAEAIEKIANNSYDLVFMDHMMPEMDGAEAAMIIRGMDGGRFSELPIVALTANAVTGAQDIFKKAGMNDFLSKPINAAHMNRVLYQWLPVEKISYDALPLTDLDGAGAADLDDADSKLFGELAGIEGLNVTDGLSHIADNRPAYLSILRQYCDELDNYISDIMKGMFTGDWDNYTVNVHAMKGVFANLGAARLSEWGYQLEHASRNGEYSKCASETEAFCDGMLLFRDQLLATSLMDEGEAVEKTAIGAEDLIQMLEDLNKACMLGDSDSAESIQAELSSRSFSDDVDAELGDIFKLIASFDFELVTEKIAGVLELLK